MAKRKTTPPFQPGTPPACLPKRLLAEFAEVVARYESAGRPVNDVEQIVLARFVMAAEDLAAAETAASKVDSLIETRANGPQVHPLHKAVESRKRELRAWVRVLPKIAAEPSPRTSATKTPTAAAASTAPTAAAGEPRLELIERIRARIAALQQQQPGGNPTHNAAG